MRLSWAGVRDGGYLGVPPQGGQARGILAQLCPQPDAPCSLPGPVCSWHPLFQPGPSRAPQHPRPLAGSPPWEEALSLLPYPCWVPPVHSPLLEPCGEGLRTGLPTRRVRSGEGVAPRGARCPPLLGSVPAATPATGRRGDQTPGKPALARKAVLLGVPLLGWGRCSPSPSAALGDLHSCWPSPSEGRSQGSEDGRVSGASAFASADGFRLPGKSRTGHAHRALGAQPRGTASAGLACSHVQRGRGTWASGA